MSKHLKKAKKSKDSTFNFWKFFFEKLYLLPIIIIAIIFITNYSSSPLSSKKDLLSYVENIPKNYSATEAIKDDQIVVNQGVITNITYFYDFYNGYENGTTSKLIYTNYNKQNEPTIKTAFHKNGKIYVNIDNSRVTNGDNEIKEYVFNKLEIIDDDSTLALVLSNKNSEEKVNLFKYNKKTGEAE